MVFSSSILKARPYRYLLLLYDFIKGNKFELSHSGESVTFDFMGNATKFYVPSQFSTYHDVVEAISWMKSAEIFFKHGNLVYSLNNINMPHEYDHGARSEFYHIFTGVGVLCKLVNRIDKVSPTDILNGVALLASRTLKGNKTQVIELDVNVNPATLEIVSSPLFRPLLKDEVRYAVSFINQQVVSENIERLVALNKYKINVVIGKNRGITTDDVKLFESVKGNYREIKLEQRSKGKS